MRSRKSIKLERDISNWLKDIQEIKEIFQKKSKTIIEYIERIVDLNKNKDEKIFLMTGLEDAIYVLENKTFEKLNNILEDILGNELDENKEIIKMFNYLKNFKNELASIQISTKNFLKIYNLNNDNTEILSNFISSIKKSKDSYETILSQMNESFSNVINYLNKQYQFSRQVDII
ncbi:MAG: hypothetical protein ACTSWR_03535 [Candidatus Helarchaeota archaeon]